jgi:hypothetical protein
MANRRLGNNGRSAQKKKLKISKRLLASGGRPEREHNDNEENSGARGRDTAVTKQRNSKKAPASNTKAQKNLSLNKQRSQTLKRQAAERMVLKEHLRELKERRLRTRKGPDAKMERRELGKYIKQLEVEQKKNHAGQLEPIEQQIKHGKKKAALAGFDGAGRDEVSEQELRDMFTHLVA